MAVLENFIETILPPIIGICELIGIFVVTVSASIAFVKYLKWLFTHSQTNFKAELAEGLASGLEFKVAAEILKTVLVRDLEELVILGAVILLRALLSVLIHVEMKTEHGQLDIGKNVIHKSRSMFFGSREQAGADHPGGGSGNEL